MPRHTRLLLFCFAVLAGPSLEPPALAQTVLDTLGLPDVSDGNTRPMARIPVDIQPGALPDDRRSLDQPIVNRNSIGLQNTASRPLSFRIEIGGQSRNLTLDPREIMTLEVGEEPGAKVTIGSGDKFTTTLLNKGQIYLLKAQGDEWVFSGL